MTFHRSYQKQFPKRPNESLLEFRERKLAAYIVSDEYKQRQSAGLGTKSSNVTNDLEQANSDEYLSEYLPSGAYISYPIWLKKNHAELTRYTIGMNQSSLSNQVGTHAMNEEMTNSRPPRQAKNM